MSGGHEFTLGHYRRTLDCALRQGYRFIGFPDLDAFRDAPSRVCVLRHDCDNDLVAAQRMATVETEMGVTSTYCVMLTSCMYNLLSPTNAPLVRSILEAGHRLGLHFDELAYPSIRKEDVSALVEREASLLAERLGAAVDVVSFHQPSEAVLKGDISVRLTNAYDREDTAGYHYLSDSNTVWREGCACEVFDDARYERLQLLIHPEWWTGVEMPLEDKWNAMFTDNFELCQASMLQRERAYHRPQRVRFEPREAE